MNAFKKIIMLATLLGFISLNYGAERAPIKSDWNKERPEVPAKDDPEKMAKKQELINERNALEKRIKDETDAGKSEEEVKLDRLKLKYFEDTIIEFNFNEITEHDSNAAKEAEAKKIERAKLNEEILKEEKIANKSQEGFNPVNDQSDKGPGLIKKITLNLDKIITNFRLERALSKNDVVKSGQLGKRLSTIYENLGKTKEGTAALDTLNKKYKSKENVLSRLKLYEEAFKDPNNLNVQDDIKEYVNDYTSSLAQSEIEFGIKNKNDLKKVKDQYDQISKILDGLGITPEQKARLDKFREESIASLKAGASATNQLVREFFDNPAAENSLKKFQDRVITIRKNLTKDIKDREYSSSKQDLESVENTLQEYEQYAQFQLDSIHPLYRSRLLSFLENGYQQLENIYLDFQEDIDPKSPFVTELYTKLNQTQEKLNNSSQRMVDELLNNSEKLKNTLGYKQALEENKNALPLSDKAETAALILPTLTPAFTQEMRRTFKEGIISKMAIDYFNNEIIKNIDIFNEEAGKKSNASKESIIYAQAILDEIYQLKSWILDYSKQSEKTDRKQLATFINALDQRAGAIRQLWAENVSETLREGSNGTPYIQPKSIGSVHYTSIQMTEVQNNLNQEATETENISIPVELVSFVLGEYQKGL